VLELLLNQQPGVTDNVDEENVPDLERQLSRLLFMTTLNDGASLSAF